MPGSSPSRHLENGVDPGNEVAWSVLLRNKMAERFASVSEDELCETCIIIIHVSHNIKQLLNSVFA